MHIKSSGIAILSGGVLAIIIFAYGSIRLLGDPGLFIGAEEVVLPKSLDQKNAERAWILKNRLAGTWSETILFQKGYGIEVIPLESGAIAEVRCNDDSNYYYVVDSQGRIYYKDKPVTNMDKWSSCMHIHVRAANLSSIGAGYVVSRISPSVFAGTDKPLPIRK